MYSTYLGGSLEDTGLAIAVDTANNAYITGSTNSGDLNTSIPTSIGAYQKNLGGGFDIVSGGELQRVALCRALLRRPKLLLADEPTGNLDEETGQRVMDLLLALAREEGSAVLYVTHSRELAAQADQVWTLHAGRLERT